MRNWILPLCLAAGIPVILSVSLVGCDGTGSDDGEANCVDGEDEDNDGLTDCDDPDCAATLACRDDDTDTSSDTGTDTEPDGPDTVASATASFYGEDKGDWAGYSIASNADLNGDGINDIVIGAPFHDCEDDIGNVMDDAGAAYVLLSPHSGRVQLKDADIKICGNRPSAELGRWVELSPDLTGDDKVDVLVSSPSDRSGRVYVFSDLSAPTDRILAHYEPSTSVIVGEDSAYEFGAAMDAGLVTRTKSALAIGSSAFSTRDASNIGRNYVLEPPFGEEERVRNAPTWFSGSQPGEGLGRDMVIEDFDGDGKGDMAIGALRANSGEFVGNGAVYVTYGAFTGSRWEASGADSVITGRSNEEGVGQVVASAGDFNHDGIADLLIGAHTAGSENGAVYVFFGSIDPFGSKSTGDAGLALDGKKAFDRAGHGADGVGDMTDDTIDDLVVGAIGIDFDGLSERGGSYLVAGGASVTGRVDLDRAAVHTWLGTSKNELSGHRIERAGDASGDSKNDFLIGAYANSEGDDKAGAVYLITGPVLD